MYQPAVRIAASVVSAVLLVSAAQSQVPELTPEQQAVFDAMIRSSGGDPDQINAARARARADAQFADELRYSLVGVYQGRTNVSGDQNWMAYADVGDRVEIQFDWKVSEARLLGNAAIQNHAATIANPRNPEVKCAPPRVSGPLEYHVRSVEQGIGANLRLNMQTAFPALQVHQLCTGTLKAIAAGNKQEPVEFMVPPPTMLSMSLPPGGDVTRSADGKSLTIRQGGWRWTFTPRSK